MLTLDTLTFFCSRRIQVMNSPALPDVKHIRKSVAVADKELVRVDAGRMSCFMIGVGSELPEMIVWVDDYCYMLFIETIDRMHRIMPGTVKEGYVPTLQELDATTRIMLEYVVPTIQSIHDLPIEDDDHECVQAAYVDCYNKQELADLGFRTV